MTEQQLPGTGSSAVTQSMTHHTNARRPSSIFSNMLEILGYVIVAVVVVWGLAYLVSISSNWLSAHFAKPDAIRVIIPERATSRESFEMRWNYSVPTSGMYALLYPCTSGVQLHTADAAGSVAIPCGTAFTVGNTSTLAVTPTASTTVDLPITIIFVPAATSTKIRAQGSATVTIHATQDQKTERPTIQTSTTTQRQETSKQTPHLPADLSVQIISATVDAYGNGSATFDIGNVGSGTSGPYTFNAILPTVQPYTYASSAQAPLSSGAHIINTLTFTGGASGIFTVTVHATDANQNNNSASTFVSTTVPSYPPTYPVYPAYDYSAQYAPYYYPFAY